MTPIRQAAELSLDAGVEGRNIWDRERLIAALERTRGNIVHAAVLLQTHRNTVGRQLVKFGLKQLPGQIRELNRQPKLDFMRKRPEVIWVDAVPKRRVA